MKTYSVFAKNPEKVDRVHRIAGKKGFIRDEDSPDFVISPGGDGTFLIAERKMPGVPKLLVRDSLICFKCHDESLDEMLDIMNAGRMQIVELPKLTARAAGDARTAVNDIVVRNRDPRRALRSQATLSSDNHPDVEVLDEGDTVAVTGASEMARMVGHG